MHLKDVVNFEFDKIYSFDDSYMDIDSIVGFNVREQLGDFKNGANYHITIFTHKDKIVYFEKYMIDVEGEFTPGETYFKHSYDTARSSCRIFISSNDYFKVTHAVREGIDDFTLESASIK